MNRRLLVLLVAACVAWGTSPIGAAAEVSAPSSTHISADEFLASPAAQALKSKDYPRALQEINTLLAQHADDPLLLRYRAVTLQHLGRTDEALAVYRRILARHPDDAPTHLFLGRAYAAHGDAAAAAVHWRWILRHSKAPLYRRWARAYVRRLQADVRRVARRQERRPYLSGRLGLFYDSNPLYKPNDKSLAARGNERQGLAWTYQLAAGYPLRLTPDGRVDVLYIGQQTFHDHGTSAVDFTSEGAAVQARQRVHVGRKPVILGGRYDVRTNWLRSSLFSVVNEFLLSAESSLTPRTRTRVYQRFAIRNVGPDGPDPHQTSRDGFGYGAGVVQYWYTADFKRHLFLKEELNLQETRGTNFRRRGWLTRLGVHTPLPWLAQTDADASIGFDYGRYPRFASRSTLDTARRRDARLEAYGALTHHWNDRLATRLFYRFINGDNTNDFFDRTRHLAGMEVVFSL